MWRELCSTLWGTQRCEPGSWGQSVSTVARSACFRPHGLQHASPWGAPCPRGHPDTSSCSDVPVLLRISGPSVSETPLTPPFLSSMLRQLHASDAPFSGTPAAHLYCLPGRARAPGPFPPPIRKSIYAGLPAGSLIHSPVGAPVT